jgi:site-specific DNA-adenine methylase
MSFTCNKCQKSFIKDYNRDLHTLLVCKEIDKKLLDKKHKTPLRYPGGKSKAIYKLEKHLPNMDNITEIHDCFLGGGSLPIYLTKLYPDKKIRVNDIYEPLYNFWINLRDNGDKLSDELLKRKQKNNTPELARIQFDIQKEDIKNKDIDSFTRAVGFWIVNKCSFSGLASSSFSEQASISNFNVSGIDALKYYGQLIKNWEITNLDYQDFIKKYSKEDSHLLYLDPPYMIKDNLYGENGNLHKIFSHQDFFKICTTIKCKHLISYNSDLLIKNAFKGYNISDYELTYTMRSTGTYMNDQKTRKELAIKSY